MAAILGDPVVAPSAKAEVLPAVIPPAKRNLRTWLAALALLAGLGLAWWQPWTASLALVSIETMVMAPATRVLAVNGRVAGLVSVQLRSLVAGELTEVAVVEGQGVAKGAVLARIEASGAEAALRQALAGLDAALVAQAEAQAGYDRTLAMGANVARLTRETAARAVDAAGQEVARQAALLDQARIVLAKYTLLAPLAGAVLALEARPGQTVGSSDVLMTITDLDHLVIETDVDESHALQIKPGQVASLQLSGEAQVRAAHVSFVSGEVDAATGGLGVKITPDAAIQAPIGLTVTANITLDSRQALTIPRMALRDDAVFVESGGRVASRPVTVLPWPASRLIVTEGLTAGDRVVLDPKGLTDGQSVRVSP